MFDKARRGATEPTPEGSDRSAGNDDDARIALRCNRKELELLDSFVAHGEFESRSELMRAALHAFVRSRAMSAAPTPRVDAQGLVEAPVRLRPDEYASLAAYAKTVGNGRPLGDLLAELVRHGEAKLGLTEVLERSHEAVRDAASAREKVGKLQESSKDLERRGVVGR